MRSPTVLRNAVAASGKTIKELAERAGVSRTAMHNYLEGHAVPHPRRVPWLAGALGCDSAELLAAVVADRHEAAQRRIADQRVAETRWAGQEAGACAQSAGVQS